MTEPEKHALGVLAAIAIVFVLALADGIIGGGVVR